MRPRSADELLKDVEPLAHADRRARLAQYGRDLAGRNELDGILRELGERGHYERFVALALAQSAGDTAHVERAMRDPDPDVAATAAGLAARMGVADAAFADVLHDAPMAVRAAVYRTIRRARLTALAESLLDDVRRRYGDREAATLLPTCGSAFVAERLADLAHAVPNWRALATRHPQVMLDYAERSLAELSRRLRGAWWDRHGAGIAATVRHDPARVLSLLERTCPPYQLPYALITPMGVLLDADSGRVLDLALAPGRRSALSQLLTSRAVLRRLARLADADLGRVARAVREFDSLLVSLLRALPPSRRAAVYDAAMDGVDLSQTALSASVLEVLPAARRAAEARRMLGLRAVRDYPPHVLEITAYLPYDEAEPALREQTRRADGADRATGYRLLISCAGRARDPQVVTRLLESFDRLRNEQDPVRMAALDALVNAPRAMFTEAHLGALDRIVDGALAARDSSSGTLSWLTRLAARIFEQGAIDGDKAMVEFSLRTFERITGFRGYLYLGPIYRSLPRGREYQLGSRLDKYLKREAKRDEYNLTFLLALALGRRGHDVPELQRALERALSSKLDSNVWKAVGYWLDPPATRGERVGKLVAADPSMVMIPSVLAAICRHRTDLLDVVLGKRAPSGRFLKKNAARYVPRAWRVWILRWTPAQREAYLKLLQSAAGDGSLPTVDRAAAVRLIAEVPGVAADRLAQHLRSSNDQMRRAALTALPWVSRPQEALPELLSKATGDDAHVATYAATRAARFVRPAELAAALEPVLAEGKVTARKEAVRLLAHHRVPDVADRLAELWRVDDLHRDVRVALVSAARQLSDEPYVWPLLEAAVTGSRDVALAAIGELPFDVAARRRESFAELVVTASRSPDTVVTGAAIVVLPQWAAWNPRIAARLAEVAGDLAETAHWNAAAYALVDCVASGYGTDELRRVIADLAGASHSPDAGADRDRPATQRLATIVAYVEQAARDDHEAAPDIVASVTDVLPAFLAAHVAASTVRWEDDGAAAALDALAALPIGGVLATTKVARALAESTGDVDPALVRPYAERLAARGDEAGGLFAAALAAECGPRAGWSAPWRDLLRELRSAGSPEVAHFSLETYSAAE